MYLLSWQLVSFLAVADNEQIALIGPAQEWFMKESPEVNPGANYLFGICLLLRENGTGRHFEEFANEESIEMAKLLIDDKLFSGGSSVWSANALAIDPFWIRLRQLANKMLSKADLWINPPKKVLWLPDWTEIWWDNYREMLPKTRRRKKK